MSSQVKSTSLTRKPYTVLCIGLVIGDELRGAAAEEVRDIQVLGEGRVAAGGLGHVGGAGATARNMPRLSFAVERLAGDCR